MASVPVFELANMDDEHDVVTSILDDVTDSLLARSLPTTVVAAATGAGTRTIVAQRLVEPAVTDIPLLTSRAPTPMFSLRPDRQVVPDEEVAASAL